MIFYLIFGFLVNSDTFRYQSLVCMSKIAISRLAKNGNCKWKMRQCCIWANFDREISFGCHPKKETYFIKCTTSGEPPVKSIWNSYFRSNKHLLLDLHYERPCIFPPKLQPNISIMGQYHYWGLANIKFYFTVIPEPPITYCN